MTTIQVVLVDDERLIRDGLRKILSIEPDMTVVGEASNGMEAIQIVTATQPDVVVMDVKMPVLDGVAATRRLHAQHPESRILMLTTFDTDKYVFEGLRAGATGYLLKDAPAEQIVAGIRATARGESSLQPSVAARVVAEFVRCPPSSPAAGEISEPLSPREREILHLVARGLSNRNIADRLIITEHTVKRHMTNILAKLAVDDRARAVEQARRLGMI
jgi:DNA-binding NarL/FixJ family response regulator